MILGRSTVVSEAEMFFSVILSLASLVLLVVVPILIVRYLMRPGHSITATEVRQFFQYALIYGLVVIVAAGVSQLLARLFGESAPTWDTDDAGLAESLGFVTVGFPLLVALLWWVRRSWRANAQQENSVLYAIYVTVAALTALLVAAFAWASLLGALSEGRFEGAEAAKTLVWGLVWCAHWQLAQRTLSQSANAAHLLLGSTIGVVFAGTGVVVTVSSALDLLIRENIFVGAPTQIVTGVGILTAGAFIFWRYWVSRAQTLPRSPLWMFFVLPLGVGGGLVLALSATSLFLWDVLVWLVGTPDQADASKYFLSTASALAAAVVGFLIWWYFRAILGSHVNADPGARRTYLYLMSGISLGTAAVGGTVVIGAFLEVVLPGWYAGASPINTLLAGLVLLGVGTSVWVIFWRSIQSLVASSASVEGVAVGRRIYLLLWIWGGAVIAVISLVIVAVALFGAAVSGTSFAEGIFSARFAVGALLILAALSVYHALLFERGSERSGKREISRKMPRSITFVGSGGDTLGLVREAFGKEVQVREDAVLVHIGQAVEDVTELLLDYGGMDVVIVDDHTEPDANTQVC